MPKTTRSSALRGRRAVWLGIVGLLVALLGSASLSHGGSFDPPSAAFVCGETVVIEVMVDASVVDLRGFTMTIQFDPNVVAPVSVGAGSLLTQTACDNFLFWLNQSPGESTIEVDASLLGCGVNGPGSIVTLEMRGVAAGQSPLQGIQAELRDSQNQTISYTLPQGDLSYSCAEVGFDPPDGSIGCHETLTVGVTIDENVIDLRGFSMVFEYDPIVVAPVAVLAGPALVGAACSNFFTWLNPSAIDGTIEVDGGILGCSIAGPGTIVTLVFEGVIDGTSYLRCTGTDILRDSTNANIPFECSEAAIQRICGVAAQVGSWGTLKAGYR